MLTLEYLADLAQRHADALQARPAPFTLRGRTFAHHPSTDLMGVVNLSADSWYRESVVLSADAAIRRGVRLAAEGAALIDIGAESTLLQAALVDAGGQQSMLVPVVKALASQNILVSVETYHTSVTRACLAAGAAVLNMTTTAGTSEFYRLVADHDAGVIICYVQGEDVRRVGDFQLSDDHGAVLLEYFSRQTEMAAAAGVKRIWIDPGMGFYYKNLTDSAARVRYQMRTFLETFRLRTLGWPTCHALPHAFEYFEDEVRCAEPFFAVLALLGRTDLLRTHEVAKVRGVLETMKTHS
jgi:dihydropteroate synthase